jgi:hypothetical protein
MDVGKEGPKAECLAYIKEVWTDMRPLSLRKKMEELARNPPPALQPLDADRPREKSLVARLSKAGQRVEISLRPEKSMELLKEALGRDYVHIKFKDTKGGTELGVRLDKDACDLSDADLEGGTGTIHLEGELRLDFIRVRCVADIDLKTLEGEGRLVKLDAEAEHQSLASA